MDMYKEAVRKKLTFTHTKGELQPQQLWDLPVESRSNIEGLKDIARKLDKKIKETVSDLFDDAPDITDAKLKFDIVMDVISTKKQESDFKTKALANQQEIEKIQEVLAAKQNSKFDNMDEADLLARLQQLKSQSPSQAK